MLNCFPLLPFYEAAKAAYDNYEGWNPKEELREPLLQILHPDQIVQRSQCFNNYSHIDTVKGFEVSIQLVGQGHFNHYVVKQWDSSRSFVTHYNVGSIQIFPESKKIWVRWGRRYADHERAIHHHEIREFSPAELRALMEIFQKAQAPLSSLLLEQFVERYRTNNVYEKAQRFY